ncbi:MAG: bifunctional anthranilate synthase component II/anthranilate phosphoribosyltransferase [Desulfomonile sp.]|nr:bifunctional anthranilate synthase component II/anthranilate phosphoribosyltransferase [Desulfomonile sp.]
MILVIDNYDSFTFNLVQCFQELGEEVQVRRNDCVSIAEIRQSNPRAVVISPGPGGPDEAGVSLQVIRDLGSSVPILGVCLGHQAIGTAFDGKVVFADRLMHGKTSPIFTDGTGLFAGMEIPFEACRYHSLVVDGASLPDCLEVTAVSDQNEVMAIRHKTYPIQGVQFHPESILTPGGKRILVNFLAMVDDFHRGIAEGRDSDRPAASDNGRKPSRSALTAPSKSPVPQPTESEVLKEAIRKVSRREGLTSDEMADVMSDIMDGCATPAQIGCLLAALRMKGETVDEITGAARVMRAKAIKVPVAHNGAPLLDTCGTGGDGAGTFNISTTVAFILAGAGVRIAKHGNRSVSSSCGSADVLMELGADLQRSPESVARCIDETGFGFLFAPALHPAMKHAAGPRREMGIRTLFNILGPLTNPAGASCQLLGVYDPELTEPIAHALVGLGIRSAMVVHGMDGLDEISLSAPTRISRVESGSVTTTQIDPRDFGLELCEVTEISGGSPVDNAAHLQRVLAGVPGARRDIALLNAAAALIIAGKAKDFAEGLKVAANSIDSGRARQKLDAFLEFQG